jgi:hypothetical protein
MGLIKNRHGVYIVRHKVPKHLEGPVARVLDNGKDRQVYLQKTTDTKDKTEAKRIAVDVLAGFRETLDQAEALLAERPLRTTLGQSEINRIAEFYYASLLKGDEEFKAEHAQADEDFTRSIAAHFDEAGIKLDMPAPLDAQRPFYGLTDRQVTKREAELAGGYPSYGKRWRVVTSAWSARRYPNCLIASTSTLIRIARRIEGSAWRYGGPMFGRTKRWNGVAGENLSRRHQSHTLS